MEGSKKEKLKDDPPPPPDVEWTEMTRAIAQVILANLMIVGGAGSISYYCYLGYVSTGVWVGATVRFNSFFLSWLHDVCVNCC